jgi:hypothetical protein
MSKLKELREKRATIYTEIDELRKTNRRKQEEWITVNY